MVAWKIPAIPPGNPGPPDRIGLFLIGGALALFMFGLETIGRGVVPQGMPQVGLVLGVMFGWAAIRHCRRVKRPALDLSLLKIPTFSQSTLAGTLFRVGAGTSPFLVPMLLQVGFGKSASEAGLVSFATALGALAMKPLARPLLKRFGFRRALIGCLAGGGGGGGAAGGLHAGLAAAADLRPAGLGRVVPQPAIHRAEHSGLRGCADPPPIRRDQLRRHSAATGPGARRGAGDDLAGGERHAVRAARPARCTTSPWPSWWRPWWSPASAPFFARLAPDAGEAVSGHGVKRVAAE